VDGRDKPTAVRHEFCLCGEPLFLAFRACNAAPMCGSRCLLLEVESWLLRRWCWRWFEQVCDGPPLHQVGSDQPREREWALDDFVGVMSQAQQHEGDHRDGDLDADGIFRGSQEVGDFQG